MIIIEAKAAMGFRGDQLKSFRADVESLKSIMRNNCPRIVLIGLISSNYALSKSTQKVFNGIVTWQELATLYPSRPGLSRANDLYLA